MLAAMTEEEYEDLKKRHIECGVKVYSTNVILPGGVILSEREQLPDFGLSEFLECGYRRLSELGGKYAVIGSGAARRYNESETKQKGIERFERDICQAGVEKVFVLHGINDLIHPGMNNRHCPMSELPDSAELIENGYKKYIEIARKHGKKIYLATILPCPRCMNDDGVREKTRLAVNEWIRTQTLADGVIDFESAVWDPADHQQIFAEYDSGDHLHPSLAGAQKMADSIPEEFLR
jgi:lysophospholipase L1-like esterase